MAEEQYFLIRWKADGVLRVIASNPVEATRVVWDRISQEIPREITSDIQTSWEGPEYG